MSFMRHIQACNSKVEEPFLPWWIGDTIYGWSRPAFGEQLNRFSEVFDVSAEGIRTPGELKGDELSQRLQQVAAVLAEEGVVPSLLHEPYPITARNREEAVARVDRVLAAYFGLRSFGQHLNGYVRDGDRIMMWIGRRARDRLIFPGALDNLVAGGLPVGVSLQENLLKECWEEAGMPAAIAQNAVPVGALSYNRVTERGFRPDVLYCYDLELPPDFEPENTDGEVEEFMLLPIEEVAEIVHETDDFKLNCNLVIIDFLIRHGLIGPGDPEYLDIVGGLRAPLGMPARESLL